MKKKVIIIGAGPAGMAAAERLSGNGLMPLILEKENGVGGISRTLEHKGWRFDIGGHRYYTLNQEIASWWRGLLGDDLRPTSRLSRVHYRGSFFNYPISLLNILSVMGPQTPVFLADFAGRRLFPLKSEDNLENWLINRFGGRLYRALFKEYSEKVWGLPCSRLSGDIGSLRIRGLSLGQTLADAFLNGKGRQVKTLIRQFHFPRLGCGMMYKAAASRVTGRGGELNTGCEVIRLRHDAGRVVSLTYRDRRGEERETSGTNFISTMPVSDLARRMEPCPPDDVLEAAQRLRWRGLVMVYLIMPDAEICPDNWIYVQTPGCRVSRIQNFKRWSLQMLADPSLSSLGMEYFCDPGDELWESDDRDLLALAAGELKALGLGAGSAPLDGFVLRVPQAYPVYETGYAALLTVLREYLRTFTNLLSIGRGGAFNYNSMDHAALMGFRAADIIMGNDQDIWSVSTETVHA